jgi:predicted nicotinamide N-methyase
LEWTTYVGFTRTICGFWLSSDRLWFGFERWGGGGVPLERVEVSGRIFELELPEPAALLEEAVVGERAGVSGWDPYWGLLWAAAPVTAGLLLRAAPRAERCLELGCGVGLVGLAGLAAGLSVTFSDQSGAAVAASLGNAERNGLAGAAGLVFGWDDVPAVPGFDFIFASDVLYDRAGHEPLLNALEHLLLAGGVVWIGDAGRQHAEVFARSAEGRGWRVRLYDERLRPLSRPQQLQYRLLVLDRLSAG